MKAIILAISTIAACSAQPDENVATQDICTIDDCPEGVTMAQLLGWSQQSTQWKRDNWYPYQYSNADLLQCQKLGPHSTTCQVDIAAGNGWGCLQCDFYYDINGELESSFCHVNSGRCLLWR